MLNYEIHGAGPPLVVLHGFGVNSKWMCRYVDCFQKTHKVVVFDMPYSGKSKFDLPHSVENYSMAVNVALKELQIENPSIVGESLGGSVAIVLSVLTKIKALVLVSPILRFESNILKHLLQIAIPTVSYTSRIMAKRMFPSNVEYKEKAADVFIGISKSLLLKSYLALAQFDAFKYLGRIKAPVLIIGGRFDRVSKTDLLEKATRILSCECYIESEAGHQVATTMWDKVGEEIERFLNFHAS